METAIVAVVVIAAFAHVVKRVHAQLTGKGRCTSGRGTCARITPECRDRDTHCREG